MERDVLLKITVEFADTEEALQCFHFNVFTSHHLCMQTLTNVYRDLVEMTLLVSTRSTCTSVYALQDSQEHFAERVSSSSTLPHASETWFYQVLPGFMSFFESLMRILLTVLCF